MNSHSRLASKFWTSLALFLPWLIIPLTLYLREDGWRLLSGGPVILLATIALTTLCGRLRSEPKIVILWLPLTVFTALTSVNMGTSLLSEISHFQGPAAPLEGVAFLLGLGVFLSSFALSLACFFWRPLLWPRFYLLISAGNVVAVLACLWLTFETKSSAQVQVTVLDSSSHPVVHAEIDYEVYGYGPGGSRPGHPTIRQKAFTNEQGVAVLQFKTLRHEMVAKVSSPGFCPIQFELGMQYNEYDKDRSLRLKTETNVASASIPIQPVLSFFLYLPRVLEGPVSLELKQSQKKVRLDDSPDAYLQIRSGKFVTSPEEADLHFDFIFENDAAGYRRTRLRLTGLNGAQLRQFGSECSLSSPLSDFNEVMRQAPTEGYQSVTVMQNPGSIPNGTIYVQTTNPLRYHSLVIDGTAQERNPEGWIRVEILSNPTGSRNLHPNRETLNRRR